MAPKAYSSASEFRARNHIATVALFGRRVIAAVCRNSGINRLVHAPARRLRPAGFVRPRPVVRECRQPMPFFEV
jgi:hypothetical protein